MASPLNRSWALSPSESAVESPPLLAALEHKTPSMLPEPLQWCAIKTAFAAARLLDAWTDKKVRKDKALNG